MDNSVSKDLDSLVTWQYDNAENICGIIDMLKEFYSKALEEPWDKTYKWVSTSEWFLAKIGSVFGIPWYQIQDGDNKVTRISARLYREIIWGYIKIVFGNACLRDYWSFFQSIFGDTASFIDNHDMSVTLEFKDVAGKKEQYLLAVQHGTEMVPLPNGVRWTNNDDGTYKLFSVTTDHDDSQDNSITNFATDPKGSGVLRWEN